MGRQRRPSRWIIGLRSSLLCGLLVGCATRTASVEPTLAPLVPVDSLPVDTAASSTTTPAPAAPARATITALPDADCLLEPVPVGGEITFVSGDRLYGSTPDGVVVRCLATIDDDERGPVRWSPLGDKATLRSATVLDDEGSRSSGYDSENVRVVWEYPDGAALLGPTATSRTLVRRTADPDRIRSEVTFLGRTDLVVSHPAGGLIVGAGLSYGNVEGIFAADGQGQNPVPLIVFEDPETRVTELAIDADGRSLLFVVADGDTARLQRFTLADRVLSEVASEQEPIQQLTTGPVPGTAAWKIGLCNSTTVTKVLDTRDGSLVVVGTGTQLEGQSVSPVGWLDTARLVVVSRPIGCDGPGDLWVWNLLDGSTSLLTTTVEFGATRTTASEAAPVVLDPTLPPVTI